ADERRIRPAALEDRLQRRVDGHRFLTRQHTGLLERSGPGDAASHVVFEEAPVEAEGRAPFEGGLIGGCVESAGPERRHECFAMGIITGAGAVTALRATIEYAPLNNFNRTMPESRSWTDSTKPLSALRSGEKHKPVSMISAYSPLTVRQNRSSSRGAVIRRSSR